MLNINYIKEFSQRFDYECISDEYFSSLKLFFRCDKGHIYECWWNAFQQGQRCPYCSKNKKLNIIIIRRIARKENYDILSNEYINSHTKYWFKCDKNHYFEKSWTNFKEGQRCPICNGNYRYKISDIIHLLKQDNYELIKYYNNNRLKVNCKNNHTYYTSLANYKSGYRCRKCFSEKLKIERIGLNNPGWKGGISCEPYCEVWLDKDYKESIKERDGHRCLNPECNKTTDKLSIHHIDYNKKNCLPRNLITICISCNAKANKNRIWHESWYKAIIERRYYVNRKRVC